jgi:protein associated with RNAse G/E
MLSQGKYTVDILKRFRMMDCKYMTMSMTTNLKLFGDMTSERVDATLYRQIIGSLMYLMNMRPAICFAVNTLSQYMVDPRQVHLIATKHVLRYLKGTIDYGLRYVADCEFGLVWLYRFR